MILKFIKNQRLKKRRSNKKLLKTLYHELGHLFIAILYEDIFQIKLLVIDKKIAQKKSSLDVNGGLSITVSPSILRNFNDSEVFVSMSFGGMCSQNLFFISNEKDISNKIKSFIDSPDENMDNDGGVKDFEDAKPYIIKNAKVLGMDDEDYVKRILKINFDYLSNPEVWNFLERFADEVLQSRKLLFNRQEIFSIFEKIKVSKDKLHSIYLSA
ncbi:hypothetical protein [Chryseobacterium sp. 22543]|uniref:hypothetical protein n=1 Tax=Chryseobacterium sp. 22543 TaxID=3453940 RepID=UPI003F87C3B4